MSSPNETITLSEAESADLGARVERFRAEWSPVVSADLDAALPPPGARHRRAVLVQLILIDMERRGAARLPFRVEHYVSRFPDDLTSNTVPAELLAAEYRLRHQYTDRPALDEYQRWFPDQYPAMAQALRAEPPATGFVQTTAVVPVEPVQATTLVDRQGPRVPPGLAPFTAVNEDVLPTDGPYPYVRKLGAGAFGTVYEALAPGDVPVAIKRIMRPSHDRANQEERRALEAIKRLSHPFLLKTHAYWIHSDRIVIAMELADGSLSDRMEFHQKQGRTGVPPEELIPLFEQAAQGLDYLHSEKISHRDIKPENILMLKGFAKVADFGLARSQQSTMTRVDDTAGTPAYMAPEMWRQQVGLHSSDQYALAATYVRARLGRMLFAATSLVDMGNAHINETPDLKPLPAPEQRVLLKALAKNPQQRYQSCVAFVEALREAVFPAPKPVPIDGGRPGLKPIIVTAVAVAVLVAVAVAAVMMAMGPREQAKQEPNPATTPNGANKTDEPKPLPLVAFEGWKAGPGEPKAIDSKRYPLTLTREEADETLVAVLVEPTPGGLDPQPRPFYMLKHKLSNRVFAAMWEKVKTDANLPLHDDSEAVRNTLLKGEWANGAKDYDPKPKNARTGITGEFADAPVLGVTLPEAMLVAMKFGGSLPTHTQWKKATGAMQPHPRRLPARDPLPDELPYAQRIAEINKRGLALGLARPQAVTYGADESSQGIKQLVSNGFEWLCHSSDDESKPLVLSSSLLAVTSGRYVGQGYNDVNVLGWSKINESPQTTTIADWERYIGVRVVLNP